MSALPRIQAHARTVDMDIANLLAITYRAHASEAELIAHDLAANLNKAERINQDNERRAFQLQIQHESKDFL